MVALALAAENFKFRKEKKFSSDQNLRENPPIFRDDETRPDADFSDRHTGEKVANCATRWAKKLPAFLFFFF